MYNLCYRLYFKCKRSLKRNSNTQSFSFKTAEKLIGYLETWFNLKYVNILKYRKYNISGINSKPRDKNIIASLTTYPARIDTVWIAIETIMRQSVKPDVIELWLAEEQFNGIDSLPQSVFDLQLRGLTIRFCDDLKSHKKYFYTLQEHNNDLVILFDDDMFYPTDTIEKLLKMHSKYPNDICCITSQHIGKNWHILPSSWRNPFLSEENGHSAELQVYTGSGSLFPPDSLHTDAFKKAMILELCPTADDLWLSFMAHLKGTRITSLNEWRPFPVEIYGTARDSLWYINAEEGMNDIQWKKLLDHYERIG